MSDPSSWHAAVDWLLAQLVEASPAPPPWRESWAQLGPDAAEEERLAVYRAVRDAHCLPPLAGCALVARQIEAIVEREAEPQLHDMDERLRVLEAAFGQRDSDLPSDESAAGYEALVRQYDEAWDRLFLAKLEACGEAEMADLYRADPEEFDRCCTLGLQLFDGRIVVRKPDAPDEPLNVDSHMGVPDAELARMALEREGIPALLGNAGIVSWLWHYSNAVGGVTVQVRRRDVFRAREVLDAAGAKLDESLPPWNCASCGQRVAGQWDACWQCGALAPGAEYAAKEETPANVAPEADSDRRERVGMPALALASLFVIFLLGGGPTLALTATPFVVLCIALLEARSSGRRTLTAPDAKEAPPPDRVITSAVRWSRVGRSRVRRAWRAAIFGLSGFPPLGLYALWLLVRFGLRPIPLSPADRLRCGVAVIVGLIVGAAALILAGLILGATCELLRSVGPALRVW